MASAASLVAAVRGAAQRLAETAHVRIDGRVIDRAHVSVRVGSVLTFVQGPRVRVAVLPTRRGPPDEAAGCYALLNAVDI